MQVRKNSFLPKWQSFLTNMDKKMRSEIIEAFPIFSKFKGISIHFPCPPCKVRVLQSVPPVLWQVPPPPPFDWVPGVGGLTRLMDESVEIPL
jgi:hypothetical protein